MEHQKELIVGNKDAVRSYVNQICSVQSRSFATNSYQTKDNISFVCYSVRHMSKAEKALSSSWKFSETIEVDDSSCYIVSHDTQYEDIVATDDFDDEDLDYDE